MSWYVIQVRAGHEKRIADKCRLIISKDILQDCFIPEYITKKKYAGEWRECSNILFKGYVFLISNQIDELYNDLKKIPDYTKIVGRKKEEICSLKDGEVEFLKSFSREDHIVEMSIGFVEGDSIHITKGPLHGKEGMIIKIDRHKRIAYISVSIFSEIRIAKVGLEIISKN